MPAYFAAIDYLLNVYVFNEAFEGTLLETGFAPFCVDMNVDGTLVAVGDNISDDVRIYDADTLQLLQTHKPTGSTPVRSLNFDSWSNQIAVNTNHEGRVSIIDFDDDSIRDSAQKSGTVYWNGWTSDGQRILCWNARNAQTNEVNTTDLTSVNTAFSESNDAYSATSSIDNMLLYGRDGGTVRFRLFNMQTPGSPVEVLPPALTWTNGRCYGMEFLRDGSKVLISHSTYITEFAVTPTSITFLREVSLGNNNLLDLALTHDEQYVIGMHSVAPFIQIYEYPSFAYVGTPSGVTFTATPSALSQMVSHIKMVARGAPAAPKSNPLFFGQDF